MDVQIVTQAKEQIYGFTQCKATCLLSYIPRPYPLHYYYPFMLVTHPFNYPPDHSSVIEYMISTALC